MQYMYYISVCNKFELNLIELNVVCKVGINTYIYE